jgi:glycosyltransferase involved in cell wall biosynthesis
MDNFNFVIITPCYNASSNLYNIYNSLLEQTYDKWIWIISDDLSTDDTCEVAKNIVNDDKSLGRVVFLSNGSDKKYALKNIVDVINGSCFSNIGSEVIIGIIDGDDQLCNKNALQLILDEYSNGNDVVWTAHMWDVNNNMNVSGDMPNNINPYLYQWCSSHFRTFRKSIFDKISHDNFKDINGNWFKRGYDQALMLPILKLSKKRKYVNEVCYLYNINSVSIDRNMDTTSDQLNVVRFVRARGFKESC